MAPSPKSGSVDPRVAGANYTGKLPKGDPRPPPPPQTPPPPGADPRNAIYAGGAPSSSNDRGGREGTRGPAPGGTQEEPAQRSGAYQGEGGTLAQGRRRAQAHPCPPDLRGKYIICYIEGQGVPQPPPDIDIVIIRITAYGDQEFDGYCPLTRWTEGNAIAETF